MIDIVTGIKEIIERSHIVDASGTPYGFYYDNRQMMNVKADNVPFPLIWFEEYTEGNINTRFWLRRTHTIRLYFCKLCQMHNEGLERFALQKELLDEAVIPFIENFQLSPEIFLPVEDFRYLPTPPQFDANEVSVVLAFDAEFNQCYSKKVL